MRPGALLGLACALALPIAAQSDEPGPWRVLERSDYSRYKDGRYLGHVYREARGSLVPGESTVGGRLYQGAFLVLEDTLRDLKSVAKRIDRDARTSFVLSPAGGFRFLEDGGYPSLRGLSLPPAAAAPGESWVGPGERVLDLVDGSFLRLPFLAEYRLVGDGSYSGRPALKLTAKFATRYRAPASPGASLSASPAAPREATGTHDLDFVVDAGRREIVFVRDHFDETFTFADGSSERRSGFTLVFFTGATALDRPAAKRSLALALSGALSAASAQGSAGQVSGPQKAPAQASSQEGAGGAATPLAEAGVGTTPPGAGPGPLIAGVDDSALAETSIDIASAPAGIVLTVKDLRFVADSDQILPSELWRLDALASALKAVPDRNLLVEGHSAATGKPEGEQELSERRAKQVADALVARGIESSRIAYRGYGSSRPIGSNDNEAGRARNRRVEITVLDY